MLKWIFRPLEVLEERAKRYGETFVISKNTSPLVVYFSNPAAIQQISPPIQSYLTLVAPTIFYCRCW
jgi:hypothetical protein